MNLGVKKIVFLAMIILIGIILWNLLIPYMKELNQETISKRIDIETSANSPQPIPILIGTSTLTAELAINKIELQRGLGERRYLEDDRGMLFIYEKDDYHSIWMKNMLFPLDIAWLDRQFNIIDIEYDVSPSTYPNSFKPRYPARYVLEVNAGYFKAHGITKGTTLKLIDDENYSL